MVSYVSRGEAVEMEGEVDLQKNFREKKKILFLVTVDWYFWTHRRSLALAAKESGYEVFVVTHADRYKSRLAEDGFRLIPMEIVRCGCNPILDIQILVKLICTYKNERIDIVHHVGIKPVLYGTLAAMLTGVRGVVNAFGGLGHIFTDRGFKAFLIRIFITPVFRIVLKGNNKRVIFQNPEDKFAFESRKMADPNKTVMIRGMGVDLGRFTFQNEPRGQAVIMFAGRMLWNKGVGELVAVSKLLRHEDVAFRMVFVGFTDEANPKSVPESTIEGWEKEGLVEWWGRQEDMPSVLSKANVVVLPTTYGEGVPKVLLEAAAVGRAIIGNDVPGCREIVIHEKNGLLVPPKDVHALAHAIRLLIDNPDVRESMGKVGRSIVEKEFSDVKVIDETMELYREFFE